MTTLSDYHRGQLRDIVYNECMQNMFGDGQEKEYVLQGFPPFKGIDKMTDDELLEEAGIGGTPEQIQDLLKDL